MSFFTAVKDAIHREKDKESEKELDSNDSIVRSQSAGLFSTMSSTSNATIPQNMVSSSHSSFFSSFFEILTQK
jgi:hypothetical protein